jgi:hypothetical protein
MEICALVVSAEFSRYKPDNSYYGEDDTREGPVPSVPSGPEPLEGLFFTLEDLQTAMAWAFVRPELRLVVATYHRDAPEVIEVYSPGAALPRWFVWRDRAGCLRVDDRFKSEFDMPYLTLRRALRFIEVSLTERFL